MAKEDCEDSDTFTNSSGNSSINTEYVDKDIISCSNHNGKKWKISKFCLKQNILPNKKSEINKTKGQLKPKRKLYEIR